MNKNKILTIINKLSAYIFFGITIISIIAFLFVSVIILKAPDITKESLEDNFTSKVYDKEGNLIANLGNERKDYISINDIPQEAIDAVLSVEDSRFHTHIGIDPVRIVKAFLVNLSAGDSLEGGSTITQQVVKRTLLSSAKSYERKIQEAYLAQKLEKKYTKDEILEMYLNKIFYSDNQYGLKTAASYYYGKELKELTIPQIATLTGIPQQPNAFNPFKNPEAAKKRRNIVLLTMYNNDKISREDYETYINTPIEDGLVSEENRTTENLSNPKYAAYIDFIEKEIKSLPEFANEEDPFSQGLHIHTNINAKLQEEIQTMLDEETYPMREHDAQAAIVVLNTKNGMVEAIGGGKNYTYGGFNFATEAKLQPGSSIKPILDYAPGVEYYNWDQTTSFQDTPYYIAGTNLQIRNWDRSYHGNVNIRRAMALSWNIPAVKAFESIGFDRSQHFAKKLGLEINSPVVTTAIGGSEDTVTPLQMASAFATFGNSGIYNKASAITKITNKDGQEIPIARTNNKAMNESTAYIMTTMMKDVFSYAGTSGGASIPGYSMAGKSGSTTFDEGLARSLGIDVNNDTKDSWLVGYTSDYTLAVWQGSDSIDSASKALKHRDVVATQNIFSHVMKKAHGEKIPEEFIKPETVKSFYGILYATDRNTETDHMYAGTSLDATTQAKKSEQSRNYYSVVQNNLAASARQASRARTATRQNTATQTNQRTNTAQSNARNTRTTG